MSARLEVDEEGFVKLAALHDLPPGEMIGVSLVWEGVEEDVALANTDGHIYAFKDICPHMNYPLSIGSLHGTKLECRGHSWLFDIRTGKAINPPIRKTLDRYPVKIVHGAIWVNLATPLK